MTRGLAFAAASSDNGDGQRTMAAGPITTPDDAFDNPEAHIPGDRRQALATGIPMPDRVHGAALFADISGFTPLTEVLANELGPQRGAEEMTAHLNRVFHALIAELGRFGGHVIYFSGDAITCWIEGDDGIRATACGLAMQATMDNVREVVTPGGTRMRLAMKVAVGSARRFLVGDPDIQRIDVLAGRLIDELVAAESPRTRGRWSSTDRRSNRSATESRSASFGSMRRAGAVVASSAE